MAEGLGQNQRAPSNRTDQILDTRFMATVGANPDHQLLRRFLAGPAQPVNLSSNPLAAQLGGRLLSAATGAVVLEFRPGSEFTQGGNVIQGGVAAMMLDFAMAFAAMTVAEEGERFATANLNVSFLKAMVPGLYEAHGSIEKRGRRLVFLTADLFQKSEAKVAFATSIISFPIDGKGSVSVQGPR